jgi:hypothetical protein
MAKTFNYGAGIWATKTGSSMAYNDQNDNYKPTPFSVTRDSIATRVNKQGLIEVVGKDKLRIDYTDSSNGVALLEPSRTNNILQSNDPSGANWTDPLSRWTLLTDTTTAPDGGTVRIIELTESGGSLIRLTGFSIAAATYTVSFYIKDIDGNLTGGSVDVGDEGIGAPSPAFGDVGSDWVRATRTITTTGTKTYIDLQPTFSGSTNKVAIWGVQLEAGSYPTSYIPTSGQSGGVTRAADVANGAGNEQVFNDSEGVLFANIAALTNDGTSRIISISDPSATNRIHLFYFAEANNIYANYRAGGTTRSTAQYEIANVLNPTKVAYKFKSGDFALWINGFKVDTDTNTTMISDGTLTKLSFAQGNGVANFYGKTKEIGVYDAVLTDAELEALTSYTSFTNMANELNLTIK